MPITANVWIRHYCTEANDRTESSVSSLSTSNTFQSSNYAKNLARRDAGVLASVAGAGAQLLGLGTVVVALELDAKLLGAGGAGVGDGGGVAVVGVDASEDLSARSLDVLDGDGTLGAVALAVTAGPVELAEVEGAEAVDGDGGGAVVLDDLVLGVAGSATLDHGGSGALEGEGVLADLSPPDVWDMLAWIWTSQG
jgi:hypothetical protein